MGSLLNPTRRDSYQILLLIRRSLVRVQVGEPEHSSRSKHSAILRGGFFAFPGVLYWLGARPLGHTLIHT